MSRRIALLVLLAVTLAAACGPSSQPTAVIPPTHRTPQATESPVSPAAPSEVRVGLTEWTITTDTDRIAGGAVTLIVTNAGSAPHDLRVTGPDDDLATTSMLQPGEQQELTITAPPPAGEMVLLWCTVPGHSQQGMRTTLQIAD